MEAVTNDCPYEQSDVASIHVARRSSADSTFEAHYFECQRCWSEIEHGSLAASVLRAAPARQTSTWRVWSAIAAALVVAVLAFAMRGPAPEVETTRGAAPFAVTAVIEPGAVVLAWKPVTAARSYRVIVRDDDGQRINDLAAAGSPYRLSRDAVGSRSSVFVIVEARDADGQIITKSSVLRLRFD